MQKVFLSHSSDDKEKYVRIVYNNLVKKLGIENITIDEMTFQEGRKTIEEIEEYLDKTDLFVFFISDSALDSKWVRDELEKAENLWDNDKLQQICPIIIDNSIKYDDTRIPLWMQNNYNIQYIGRPTKSAQIIIQRMIELSYERHPRLKERNAIFVGRNKFINSFEERMDDFEKNKPICVIASGIRNIGRKTLIKKCIFKSNIRKETYPFSNFSLNYNESIEDFIFKLFDLGIDEKVDLKNLMKKGLNDKINVAIKLIQTLQLQDEIIFIEDNGCIINHDGEISTWFTDIISNQKIKAKLTFCLIAKFRLLFFGENVSYLTKEKVFSLEVDELSKKERDGLLNRYLKFENIEIELSDKKLISGLLTGFPEQIFYTVSLIKEKGMEYVREHTYEIVEFNNKKASIIMKEFEKDEEKKQFLALLSAFDYIGFKFIMDVVDNDKKYMQYINEFILNAICEYVGSMKEYIRVNETIKDYVERNDYQISSSHRENMQRKLNIFLNNLTMDEYDIPEFLFSLKQALIEKKDIDDSYLIPSLYLKTMSDFYNRGKNKDVVAFADKALENEEFMDSRMVFEVRYLLCSALAKMRDKRFLDEVHKIKGADFYFLFGFYYRQIGKFDKALEMINKSLNLRKNFSKAKREKVQVYIGMQEFSVAKELAEENYFNYKNNPYHIQAYFSCLIKSEKNRDNRKILQNLISSLSEIDSDTAKEMELRCRAQFEAFYNDSEETAMSYINQAIEMNPDIQYARIVKFDICERFNRIDEMKDILEFLKKKDYLNKYHNNVICFTAIIMAKEGKVEEAIDYYSNNIRNYTDEAKDKFIIRLNKFLPRS